MKKLLILIVFLTFGTFVFAQPAVQWQRAVGGSGEDTAYSVEKTSDGGYISAGWSNSTDGDFEGNQGGYDCLVVKFSANGTIEWQKTLGGSGNDYALYIVQAGDGGYMMVGQTYSDDGDVSGNHGDYDAWVVKLDETGNIQWQKCMGGSYGDYFTSIQRTSVGGFILAGYAESFDGDVSGNHGSGDVWVVKINESGDIEWQKCLGGTFEEGAEAIQQTYDGGYILAGWTASNNGDVTGHFGSLDYWVVKLNAAGDIEWQKSLGGPTLDYAADIKQTQDSGYIVAGWKYPDDGLGGIESLVAKLAPNGDIEWQRVFGTSIVNSVLQSQDGGYVLAGSFGLNGLNGLPGAGFGILKITETGDIQWQGSTGYSYPREIYSLQETEDGGFIGAGSCDDCLGMHPENPLIRNFWIVKLFFPPSAITGRVHLDPEDDCLPDDAETGLSGWLVKATGNYTFHAMTDADGYFFMPVDTGTYELSHFSSSPYLQECDNIGSLLITENDTLSLDFPVQPIADCPYLTVDIATLALRRCFDNFYVVQYCNYGTTSAEDAYIEISLDPHLQYVSSTRPLSAQNGNLLTFDLGAVGVNECGSFRIVVYLDCASTVLGQTHCTTAHIFPDSLCIPPDLLWDGSSIEVEAQCEGDSVVFILHNTGAGAMSQQRQFIIIEDDIVLMQGSFQLDAAQTQEIGVIAQGATLHLEAQQSPGHPAGIASSGATIEGCNGWMTIGFFTQWPFNNPNPFVDTDCRQNIGSYDPNDKTAFPTGFGPQRLLEPGQDIEYMIRFQNTGTDTAFKVVIVDVLPPELNLGTLRPGAASHPYTYSVTPEGQPVFTFDNILLPDSTTNLDASQGFVNFRISQQPGLPIGTEIANKALIYFDFNEPIETNYAQHRIGIVFPWAPPGTVSTRPVPSQTMQVRVIPNPSDDRALLQVEGIAPGRLRLVLTNTFGQVLHTEETLGTGFEFRRGALPAGLYFFKIEREGRVVGTGKIILR